MSEQTRQSNPVKTLLLILVVVGMVVCLVLMGAFVAMFGWRTLFARANDAEAAGALFERVTKRLDQEQTTPPADNAYDVLKDYLVNRPPATLTDSYKALGDLRDGTRAKTTAKMNAKPDETAKLAQVFETSMLPLLRSAAQRPRFVYPFDWRKGMEPQNPNWVELRAMASALCVDGLYQEQQKRFAQAADDYLIGLPLGQKAGHGSLIGLMVGITMQSMDLEPLSRLLSEGVLPPADNQRVLQELSRLSFDKSDFIDSRDMDYVEVMQTLNLMAEGKYMGGAQGGVVERFFGPMVARRSAILYQNYYQEVRPSMVALDLERLKAAHDAATAQLQNTIVGIFMTNSTSMMAQFMASRTALGAALVKAALQAYRHDNGKYPATLDALVPKYLKSLPPDLMTQDRRFGYTSTGTDFTLTSSSALWQTIGLRPKITFHPYIPLFEQK